MNYCLLLYKCNNHSRIFRPAEILSDVFKKSDYVPVIESDSDNDENDERLRMVRGKGTHLNQAPRMVRLGDSH